MVGENLKKCSSCNRSAAPGRSQCVKCLAEHAAASRRDRAALVATGKCVSCRNDKGDDYAWHCIPCVLKEVDRNRLYRQSNPRQRAKRKARIDARADALRQRGLCTICGKSPAWRPGSPRCDSCRMRANDNDRELYQARKAAGNPTSPAKVPF
jgi:hypothetical protein